MSQIKAIITGATGMVGKGVLLECLDDPRITSVLVINRQSVDINHPKLTEIIHKDFLDLSPVKDQLAGYDACFFCLGISAAGMSEEAYTRITYDMTLHMAKTLKGLNKDLIFCYVSGTGTDSSEKGRMMWARVKGKTENDLLKMGFKDAYMFRPGFIQPMKGIKSKTRLYQTMYNIFSPFYPLLKRLFPKYITNTSLVGKAMIEVATTGSDRTYFENKDINEIAGQS